MNLIPGVLRTGGDSLVFSGDELTAAVPAALAERIKSRVGKEIILGLRPRSFLMPGERTEEEDAVAPWVAIPEIAEMLGDESLVHLRAGSNLFVVSVHPHRVPSLDVPCDIYPIMAKAHFFNPETGQNMTLNVDIPGRDSIRKTAK